jgi:hypothetical protein
MSADKTDMIFSGDASKSLWKDIWKVKRRRKKIARAAFNALYHLGCKCQELETKVQQLTDAMRQLLDTINRGTP